MIAYEFYIELFIIYFYQYNINY